MYLTQVDHLIRLVTDRFPQTDLKTLTLKLNQKCKDKTRAAGQMRRNIREVMDDPQTNDDDGQAVCSLLMKVSFIVAVLLQGIMVKNE